MLLSKKNDKLILIKAVEKGNLKKVKKIIENELVNIDIQNREGYTALHTALRQNYKAIARLLIYLGADVNKKTNDGITALHIASKLENDGLSIVKLLIENGAIVNIYTSEGNAPLHEACIYGRSDIVKYLVENGSKINIKGNYGFTPLHEAAVEGYYDIVKLLIEKGADVNIHCDIVNWTPLYYAIRNFHKNIIKILIESGSEVNAFYEGQESPLHMIIDKKKRIKGTLNNFDVMMANLGSTNHIYHIPTEEEKLEIIKLLIKNGANINAKGYNNKTPLQYAIDKGYMSIINFLKNNGAIE